MRRSSQFCLVLLAFSVLLLSGKNSHAAPPVKIDIPATPDGTIVAICTAVSEGHFEVLWQALPASYQADVKQLLKSFSQQIEPQTKLLQQRNVKTSWSNVISAVGKLSQVLATKQDLLVARPGLKDLLLKNKITDAEVKLKLPIYSSLLDDIQKQIETPEQIEKLDVEQFLANLGARAKELNRVSIKNRPVAFDIEELKKVTAMVKESTPDSATVEISDGKSTNTVQMVKVEGKWIPKDFADSWKRELEKLDKSILADILNGVNITGLVIAYAPIFESDFDRLLKAKNQKEFDLVEMNFWEQEWIIFFLEHP